MRFMVQAVNGVGLVSLDDNGGNYYQADQIPPALQTRAPTRRDDAAARLAAGAARLTASRCRSPRRSPSGGSPVANGHCHASRSAARLVHATTASGVASDRHLPLVDLPGDYTLTASLRRRRRR